MKFNNMTSFRESLPNYKRCYAEMRTKKARTAMLDRLTVSHGIDRKYLTKLLRGTREYKPHTGRSSSYNQSAKALLMPLWCAAGMPCAEYLKPMLRKLTADYIALGNEIEAEDLKQLFAMSASTIGRAVRTLRRDRDIRRNKRSGANRIRETIPEMPGSQLPEDNLGTCQVDTVALCGGNMGESFFYIATLTDAATQWFECAPSWNHSAEATSRAMRNIHPRLPFGIKYLHSDNGGEFINRLFIQQLEKLDPDIHQSRSRPYRKNDNCRIEQKNGSVIRDYFSDIRFDNHEQYHALEALCKDIALYTNLFRPCKKLVSKELKSCKGVKYVKRYDTPQTPLERLTEFLPADNPCLITYQHLQKTVNSITLMKSIQSQLRKLVRDLNVPLPADGIPSARRGSPRLNSAPRTTCVRCPRI